MLESSGPRLWSLHGWLWADLSNLHSSVGLVSIPNYEFFAPPQNNLWLNNLRFALESCHLDENDGIRYLIGPWSGKLCIFMNFWFRKLQIPLGSRDVVGAIKGLFFVARYELVGLFCFQLNSNRAFWRWRLRLEWLWIWRSWNIEQNKTSPPKYFFYSTNLQHK